MSKVETTAIKTPEQIQSSLSLQLIEQENPGYGHSYLVTFRSKGDLETIATGGTAHAKDDLNNYFKIGTPNEINVENDRDKHQGVGLQMFFCLCALAKVKSSQSNLIYVVDTKKDEVTGTTNEVSLSMFLTSIGVNVEAKSSAGGEGLGLRNPHILKYPKLCWQKIQTTSLGLNIGIELNLKSR